MAYCVQVSDTKLFWHRNLVMVDSLALAAGTDDGIGAAGGDVAPALSSLLLFIVVLPTISRVIRAIGFVGIHTK